MVIYKLKAGKLGGYQIKVHFFEFWEANDDRLNYRECYEKTMNPGLNFFFNLEHIPDQLIVRDLYVLGLNRLPNADVDQLPYPSFQRSQL